MVNECHRAGTLCVVNGVVVGTVGPGSAARWDCRRRGPRWKK